MAHVNLLKQFKTGNGWVLKSIPRKPNGQRDWGALPDGSYFIEWREGGKRMRLPAGRTVSEALKTQHIKLAELAATEVGILQRYKVVDKRSEYSERSLGRGVCFGGGNRGGFGANQIVYGAECGGGSALHRSLNDASESRKCFCAAVVFRTVRKLAGNNGRPHGPFRSIVGRFDGLIAQELQYATLIVL